MNTGAWTDAHRRAAPLDLDAIDARAKAATSGPWDHRGQQYAVIIGADNVAFVDHAQPDVLALVAEVRKLRADLRVANCGGTTGRRPPSVSATRTHVSAPRRR